MCETCLCRTEPTTTTTQPTNPLTKGLTLRQRVPIDALVARPRARLLKFGGIGQRDVHVRHGDIEEEGLQRLLPPRGTVERGVLLNEAVNGYY